MNPGLVVKLRPSGPWRIGPDSGVRNRVDVIYHSDSLYSAVTGAMARLGRLPEWLDATARSAAPVVCFSSCFPFIEGVGFVVPPRTAWPPQSPSLKAAHVRWKSARFIPLEMVQSILAGERLDEDRWSVDGASGCLLPVGKLGPFRTNVRWGAAVDRLSGASERHSTACIEFRPGAGLWTVAGFSDEAARDQWQPAIKAAFRLLADSGFGGERSRGWGRAETPEFIEGELPGMIIGEPRKKAAPEPEVAEARVVAPRVIQALEVAPEAGAPEEVAAVPEGVAAPDEGAPAPEGVAAAVIAPDEGAPAREGVAEVHEEIAAPEEGAPAPEGVAPVPEGIAPPDEGAPAPVAAPEDLTAVPEVIAAPVAALEGVPGVPEVIAAPVAAPEDVAAVREGIAPPDEGASAPEGVAPVPEVIAAPVAAPEGVAPVREGIEPPDEGAPAPEGVAPVPEVIAAQVAAPEDVAAVHEGIAPPDEGAPAPEGVAPVPEVVAAPVAAPEDVAPFPEGIAAPVAAPEDVAPVREGIAPPVVAPEDVAPFPEGIAAPDEGAPAPVAAPEDVAAVPEVIAMPDETAPAPAEVATAPEHPITPAEVPARQAGVVTPRQAHWLLSLFTPGAADTVDWGRGSYTVMARGGRVDSPAGSGELKKQIQMIAEGSVLVAGSAPRGAAPDVAPDGFAHPVFRAGFALAIPLPEGN